MHVIKIPIEKLKHYDKNTKQHPPEQIEKISRSIKEFGFNVPIIVDKDNVLIAGHGRVIAAEQTKRKCYMMELDPKYCQVIINRWETLTNQKAEKII